MEAVARDLGQSPWPVRMEWGPTGAEASPADAVVVVDVLSFSTTASVAVGRGVEVHPFRWRDERAAAYARSVDAVLAVGRRAAGPGEVSLSPASVLAAPDVRRLVLPSPNGATICARLAETGAEVWVGCLRNAAAVAGAVAPRLAAGGTVTVVAAGERWPDGSLRPAVEDLWGAGAVLSALVAAGVADQGLSPEAEAAASGFDAVAGRLPERLHACASGRELAGIGFAADVDLAAESDAEAVAPVLRDGALIPFG